MNTYREFDELMMRAGKPVPSRKIANNTYAQRLAYRGEPGIGIKYHDTYVVVLFADGTIRLDTGGWFTTSTRDRMNRVLPDALRVHSIKGRWMVTTRQVTVGEGEDAYTRPDYENSTPYVDGIRLASLASRGVLDIEHAAWVVANGLSPSEEAKQDAHNARVEKLLDNYLRWLTPERYEMIFQVGGSTRKDQPACGMCVRTSVGILVGDSFGDKQHLIEHLIDKDMPFAVFYVACDHGRGDDGLARARFLDFAKRDLRKYLRTQLYVGPVAIKGGKRPAHTPSWSLSAQLNKSRRKPA